MEKGLGTNGGGGVVKPKSMPYDPPKASKPMDKPRIHDLKIQDHGCCGTQGKH